MNGSRSRRAVASALIFALVGLTAATRSSMAAPTRAGIDASMVLHNSLDLTYRSPMGAVPVGTPVTIRLRTGHAAVTAAALHVEVLLPSMKPGPTTDVAMHPTPDGQYDMWETVVTPKDPAFYTYLFQLTTASGSQWYGADPQNGLAAGRLVSEQGQTSGYVITAYNPGFTVPSWLKDAVMYQIFPDRFYNGDKSNDKKGMNPVWGALHPIVHTNVNAAPSGLVYGQFDFYGGDLAGITKKLPYLQKLGVTVLYLTPIFKAATNHKYDTADYMTIDPRFGTLKTFKTLIAQAHARHIRVILDGVFNHTGWDSIYFNRFGSFKSTGAYQSLSSPYASWYTFQTWPQGYKTYYDVLNLPELSESDGVKDFIFRKPNSVAQYWLQQGADGWRLDHSMGKSAAFWQEFYTTVKARFPNDAVICECDFGAGAYAVENLLGDQFDGDMNYPFRTLAFAFFNSGKPNSLGQYFTASQFLSYTQSILSLVPKPAIEASMNLIGTHDTDRAIDVANGSVAEMKQLATFQMTMPGMPEIYYGDEAGRTGSMSDPNRRKFFPWSNPNTDLQAYYTRVIHIRESTPALRDGTMQPLLADDASRIAGYLRTNPQQTVAVIFNDDTTSHTVSVPITAFTQGMVLKDAISGATYTVGAAPLQLPLPATSAAILVPQN